MIKGIVGLFLALVSRAVIRRYHPTIVMITGSVGKTSTKDAVASVLMSKFIVRKSEKSFNSEFGVPFTILGVENPWHNPMAWLSIVTRSISLLLLPNQYPRMLVLEVGSGKPGDLAHILKIVTPHAVVVTSLPEIPVHVEAYTSPEAVREEEFSPALALKASSPLIVPADDSYTLDSAVRTTARIFSYGTAEGSLVRLTERGFYESSPQEVVGMRAHVTTTATASLPSDQGELIVEGSVGFVQLLPAAAAITVGLAFDIPLTTSLEALASYVPPPGRGRLISGKRGALIIDDSYNASPSAVEQALGTLKKFPYAKRRIAILGDMLELGRYSVMEHQRIAEIADVSADLVVAVGIRARAFTVALTHSKTLQYDTSRAAVEALPDLIQEGDVVLVKGSQSIRMERIVEALLADPLDAAILVRQEKAWKKKG